MSLSALLSAQTFRAAVLGGINMAQIDGDNIAGFDKVGWNAGVKAYAFVKPEWSLSFELLYSQKGAKTSRVDRSFGRTSNFTLEYAEVPILVHYHDKNGMIFGAGVSYSQLFQFTRIENGVDTSERDPIPSDRDWNIMGEITFVIKDHFGINGRVAYSLWPIAYNPTSNLKSGGMVNNIATLRFSYIF
jgi:hypothetical protein